MGVAMEFLTGATHLSSEYDVVGRIRRDFSSIRLQMLMRLPGDLAGGASPAQDTTLRPPITFYAEGSVPHALGVSKECFPSATRFVRSMIERRIEGAD